MGYLDNAGVARLWAKIKAYVSENAGGEASFLNAHPVGSIYLSVDPANPGDMYGGTWVRWGAGRVPVGVGESRDDNGYSAIYDSAELTGGETLHGLTTDEMPSHSHPVSGTAASAGAHTHSVSGTAASAGSHRHNVYRTQNAGSGSNRYQVAYSDGTATQTEAAGAHTHSVSGTAASAGAHEHSVNGTAAAIGGGASHNNLQPYITCYMWKRTA